MTTPTDIQESFLINSFIHSNTEEGRVHQVEVGERDRQMDTVLMLAKNLFELREYKKCCHMLKEHLNRHPHHQSLIFYYHYAQWMSGLIRKEEQIY